MARLLRCLIAGWISLAVVTCALAQTLPHGEHHENRERDCDIRHYRADIEIDTAARLVVGTARITLSPLHPIDRLGLDAYRLTVDRVALEDGTALAFDNDGHRLEIRLPEVTNPERTLRIDVTYSATPGAGMSFQPDPRRPGQVFVTTYGEAGIHANWLPIYNDVNDKFTTEMRVTVPEPYTVISNGTLLETVHEPGSRTTFHWKQDRPHSNYLLALYVGEFERGELEPAFGTIPMAYWVPRGRLDEGAWVFRNTTRMVEFFSERFDYRYPWVKYDQIAVPDYPVGAMEHTGVTGHHSSLLRLEGQAPNDFGSPNFDEYHTDWTDEAIISHELAHHWFGNNLTCRNLSHIWLNESFASYLMMLWAEELHGRDQLLFDVELARRHYLEYVEDEKLIRPLEYHEFDSANDIYNEPTTYLKGGAVLHMLRAVLGDDAFFGGLAHYLDKHEYENVESHDLKIALEEATGRNLGWFFDDWITGGGHPELRVSHRYLEDLGKIDLSVKQVQPIVEGQDLFRLPVTVTVATPSRTWQRSLLIDEAEESFLIDSPEKPLMVSFDGAGDIVAEIDEDQDLDELLYQARHEELIGRLRALRQLAERHARRDATRDVFEEILEDGGTFWGLRAEAARQLDRLPDPEASALAAVALASDDYRVRKAAVLALAGFRAGTASERLRGVIRDDPHSDVVGAAIVALSRHDASVATELLRDQLKRDSWYDEIRIATQVALKELKRPGTLESIRPYTDVPFNQDLRMAALDAWAAVAPTDPELHRKLLALAEQAPYAVQLAAVEHLGRLYVADAVPLLERLIDERLDTSLTQNAKRALDEITRLRGER
jgi:aminopeptidase N